MHELALSILPLSAADSGDNNVNVALIITAGSVITGLFGLLVAMLQRERGPRSTVTANSNNNPAGEQGTMLHDLVARLQSDFDDLEIENNDTKRRFRLLRRAVRRKYADDPDTLIADEEAREPLP